MRLSRKGKFFKRKRHTRSRKSVKRLKGGQAPPHMKVAVLFAGRIKSYEHVLSKLLEFKNKYAPTYYCSLNKPEKDEEVLRFSKELGISPENINTEITPFPDFLNLVEREKIDIIPHNVYSMFYHENKAFSLIEKDIIENKKQYDCIVYTRADIDSPDTLDLVMPKPNTVYIPEEDPHNGLNDRTAYGDFDAMKKYCSVIGTLTSAESMNGVNPEVILKRYLEEQQLKVVLFKYRTYLRQERNKRGQ